MRKWSIIINTNQYPQNTSSVEKFLTYNQSQSSHDHHQDDKHRSHQQLTHYKTNTTKHIFSSYFPLDYRRTGWSAFGFFLSKSVTVNPLTCGPNTVMYGWLSLILRFTALPWGHLINIRTSARDMQTEGRSEPTASLWPYNLLLSEGCKLASSAQSEQFFHLH